jgi:hypothetical protein
MTRRIPGAARIAGTLTLAGALSLIAIMPAAAAAPNEGYAAGATGLISAGPLGLATYPGTSPVSLLNANIAGLLTTGVVTDTADATDASSTIADVSATLTALVTLSATTIGSSCTFNTNSDAVSGTTTIAGGEITLPLTTITLAASPAPNTVVAGLAGIATVTLNAQTTAVDGTLTVTAVQISLIGSTQTLSLGVSVCNDANLAPVPILPGKSMPIALGAAGVLGLAGTGLQLRRRRLARAA